MTYTGRDNGIHPVVPASPRLPCKLYGAHVTDKMKYNLFSKQGVYVCAQSCRTLCNPTDCSQPGSSVHAISQAGKRSRLPFPTPGDLPDPGIKPTSLMSPGLAGGFLPSEPPRICLQNRKPRSRPRVRKSLWIREWLPTPVLLPEKSHGQRSLAGYSPWGHKESDTTERLTL